MDTINFFLRSLKCNPITPERPPKSLKIRKSRIEKEEVSRREKQPWKPKIPTPPDSPGGVKAIDVKCNRPTTCYSSDDSGRGTCTASDLSDDYGDINFEVLGKKEASQHELERNRRVRITSDISKLRLYSYKIEQQLSMNSRDIAIIMGKLEMYLPQQEMDKIYWYLVDVERITLLMSTLARRLARTEMRMRNRLSALDDLKNKTKKIEEQLNDAININNILRTNSFDPP